MKLTATQFFLLWNTINDQIMYERQFQASIRGAKFKWKSIFDIPEKLSLEDSKNVNKLIYKMLNKTKKSIV